MAQYVGNVKPKKLKGTSRLEQASPTKGGLRKSGLRSNPKSAQNVQRTGKCGYRKVTRW